MSTKLERILAMVSDINRGHFPTVNDLCDKFEIKQRTLHDDIRFIKDRLRIEISFDKKKQGYFNATPERELPDFDLSDEELLALTLGKNMLMQHSGPLFRVPLEEGIRKIAMRLAKKESIPNEEIAALMRFIPGGVTNTDGKLLMDLKKACNDGKTVEMEYFSAHSGSTSVRKIDPYRILQFNNAWYVVAWSHERMEMRKFAVHRISQLTVLKEKFTPQADFDVDEWIGTAFMLEHGDGEHMVAIKFSPIGARFAVERVWHPSQQITSHPDGSCTMEFTTHSFDEVKRWVLTFGRGAEVLSPPELRRRVSEELSMTLRQYKDGGH